MKRTTTIVTVLVLAAIGEGIIYFYRSDGDPTYFPPIDAASEASSPKKSPAVGEPRPRPIASERKTERAGTAEPVPVAPVARQPATTTAAMPDPSKLEKWKAAADNPDVLRRLQLEARQKVSQRYGPFLDQLPLEQRERLVQLLADKRLSAFDAAASSFSGGNDPTSDPGGFADLVTATRVDLENQIKTLLGEEKYNQYREFGAESARASLTLTIADTMRGAKIPLTDEQSSQLTELLKTENVARITPKVARASGSFLSPQQIQALRDLAALQNANSSKRNRPPVDPLPVDPTR